MNKEIRLANDVLIPTVGFGTFQIPSGIETYNAVSKALDTGYRHIDTAEFYGNEESVGKAVADSKIDRSSVFITTKVWNNHHGYHETIQAYSESLKKLQTDYVDLYLIHWPKEQNVETWKVMEDLYNSGKIRSIGVSNFKKHHLEEILSQCTIPPMVNQIELHPFLAQKELCSYCKRQNIVVEAWSPMMRGGVKDIPLLAEIADKYQKDSGQIALRWHLQRGIVVLPRSVKPQRILSNLEIFDFELTDSEMSVISKLDKHGRIGPDPDFINF